VTDRPPNQIARVIAVGGVIAMFLLVIVVIAISAGGSSDSSGGAGTGTTSTAAAAKPESPKLQKQIANGVYVVKEGDTLTSISAATGVDIDTLIQLNPTTDPQTLIAGAKIKLR
jgi:LysM repeat protein